MRLGWRCAAGAKSAASFLPQMNPDEAGMEREERDKADNQGTAESPGAGYRCCPPAAILISKGGRPQMSRRRSCGIQPHLLHFNRQRHPSRGGAQRIRGSQRSGGSRKSRNLRRGKPSTSAACMPGVRLPFHPRSDADLFDAQGIIPDPLPCTRSNRPSRKCCRKVFAPAFPRRFIPARGSSIWRVTAPRPRRGVYGQNPSVVVLFLRASARER